MFAIKYETLSNGIFHTGVSGPGGNLHAWKGRVLTLLGY